MGAVIPSETHSGPGWLAVVSPGRIQVRTSPDAVLYGVAPELDALDWLLPEGWAGWSLEAQWVDSEGWDVWLATFDPGYSR